MYLLLSSCGANITFETNLGEILETRIPYAQIEQLSNGLFQKITIQGVRHKVLITWYSLGKLVNSQNASWKKSREIFLWPGIIGLCKVMMNGRMFLVHITWKMLLKINNNPGKDNCSVPLKCKFLTDFVLFVLGDTKPLFVAHKSTFLKLRMQNRFGIGILNYVIPSFIHSDSTSDYLQNPLMVIKWGSRWELIRNAFIPSHKRHLREVEGSQNSLLLLDITVVRNMMQ